MIRLLAQNLVRLGTLTATSEAAGFPKERLFDRARYLRWKATSAIAQDLILDCGYPRAASAMALVNPALYDYAQLILAANPRGYWRLGEALGAATAVDSGVNALNMPYVSGPGLGAPSLLPSEVDTACHLVRTVEYVGPVNDVLLRPAAAVTFECWVKVDSTAATQYLGGCGDGANNGYQLLLVNRQPRFIVGTGAANVSATAAGALTVDTVYHVAGTFDGANVRVYVNGVVQDTQPLVAAIGYGAVVNFYIGRFNTSAASSFGGIIDEVSVYASAVSAATLLVHYNTGLVGPTVSLFADNTNPPTTAIATLDAMPAATSPVQIVNFTSVSARFWYASIPVLSAAAELGELFIGASRNVTDSPSFRRSALPTIGNREDTESNGGYVWSLRRGASRAALDWVWGSISDADRDLILAAFADSSDGTDQLVVTDTAGLARWMRFRDTMLRYTPLATGWNEMAVPLVEAL